MAVNSLEQVNLAELKRLCKERKIRWREHALQRMKERNIKRDDVKQCIDTGEIVEYYPDDYPTPSCLILGVNLNNQYLHVVCSVFENTTCIITAYYPNTIKWENDFRTRKAVK